MTPASRGSASTRATRKASTTTARLLPRPGVGRSRAESSLNMESSLHIIAACTDRKRAVPLPHHRLGALPAGRQRAERWVSALQDGQGSPMAARDLYVGNHWAIVRDLPDIARRAGWRRVRLWVASGGYGLLDAETKAVAYGATFSIGHRDSVVDATSVESVQEQACR